MEQKQQTLSDAPASTSAKAVKEWLMSKGACGIITTNAVAAILGISQRVVKDAERAGKIKAIDKCTYNIDSIVEWLRANPRFMAQSSAVRYEVTPETVTEVKTILKRQYPRLLALYFNDVEDCAHDVILKLSQTVVTKPCSDYTIIVRAINNLWHSKQIQQANKTCSIEEIRGV